jgi:hypothetical protein
MKKTISKLMFLAGLMIMAGLLSCEGPAGPPGADGADGIDGVDGTNGTDGADGADGNANVTIVGLLSSEITWSVGSYLGRDANVFSFTETAVNQDIIDHGLVLGYCFLSSRWWTLPFIWENNGGTSTQHVVHSWALNTISLYAYNTAGPFNPGGITQYRFLLITDNTVTKSASSNQDIIDRLTNLGVDVNDYYEVMDYFGLEY